MFSAVLAPGELGLCQYSLLYRCKDLSPSPPPPSTYRTWNNLIYEKRHVLSAVVTIGFTAPPLTPYSLPSSLLVFLLCVWLVGHRLSELEVRWGVGARVSDLHQFHAYPDLECWKQMRGIRGQGLILKWWRKKIYFKFLKTSSHHVGFSSLKKSLHQVWFLELKLAYKTWIRIQGLKKCRPGSKTPVGAIPMTAREVFPSYFILLASSWVLNSLPHQWALIRAIS